MNIVLYIYIMQGRKDFIPKMMYQLHLDDLVPKDNFYRQLDSVLDLHFLYDATDAYYGPGIH